MADGVQSGAWRGAMLDGVGGQLERYMDLLSARQRLVSANIANADTPGYLTQDLDFAGEMRNASGGPPHAMDAPGLALKNDGTTSVWTGKRACWRRTRCASRWLPR